MPRQHTTNDPTYRANRAQLLASNPPCHWCGAPATTADHVVEVMNGGGNELNNLVPACRPCNSRRGAEAKARRDTLRAGLRRIEETRFFTQDDVPPTPCFSQSFGNQPESDETGQNQPGPVRLNPDAPRLETITLGGNSYGPQVAAWAQRHLNIELMPWQIYALTGQLQHNADGELLFRESLVSTARQQGKSVSLVALIGWWTTEFAALRGAPQSILSTANKLDRAEAIFTQLAPILVESFGGKALQAIGRKSVTMPDGSRWEVRAASPTLHGGSFDLCVVDELWNIGGEVLDQALRPSTIARRSPLISMWSTAGDQSSECMIQIRSAALADIDEGRQSLTYFAEWSLPPGADPRDEDNWRYANPALGRTVTIEALRAMSNKESFLRAHLNCWVTARDAWLENGRWDECTVDIDIPAGGVLAIDSSVDSSRYLGVRSVQLDEKVLTFIEFNCDSEQAMWDEVDRVMTGTKTHLLVTPTLEVHLPEKYTHRYGLWGYAELLRYTSLVRNMILEDRVVHTGQQTLAEHVNRAVMVRTAQGAAISSQRSPGPIEACRCMIASVASVSRPVSKAKPMLVIAKG